MALKKSEDELSSDEIRQKIEASKKLIEEQQKLKRRLSRKIKDVVENEKRQKENRIKSHAGGMMRMTGLLNYIYPNAELHDNEQDELIANLLVGGLLTMSEQFSEMPANKLHTQYMKGKEFRDLAPEKRKVPEVNKQLQQLFDLIESNKKTESSEQ